jgi:hypothetical protein
LGDAAGTTSRFVHWDFFEAPVESQTRAQPDEGKDIGTPLGGEQQPDLQAFVTEADDCAAP